MLEILDVTFHERYDQNGQKPGLRADNITFPGETPGWLSDVKVKFADLADAEQR